MEDLQIAYYFAVIMIGFAALAISGFWAVKTQDTSLRNFCILYAAFTLMLILSVLMKYLTLNVESFSGRSWYLLSGICQVINYGVIVATVNYFLGLNQTAARKRITILFWFTILIFIGFIFSPYSTRLDETQNIIQLKFGYQVLSVWYLLSFTYAIVLGFTAMQQAWNTDKRNFILGLLIFATFGYIESLLTFSENLRTSTVSLTIENGLLFSSIPYMLYGFFVIRHFLSFAPPTPIEVDQLSENFLSAHAITDREREIILKVIEGKSNATIASELFISLATVKTHLHNIYTKIGVESRFDLLARVRSAK
jgi:DNA-binding CsgD family transcriptional regulator